MRKGKEIKREEGMDRRRGKNRGKKKVRSEGKGREGRW